MGDQVHYFENGEHAFNYLESGITCISYFKRRKSHVRLKSGMHDCLRRDATLGSEVSCLANHSERSPSLFRIKKSWISDSETRIHEF